jgi:F-type H+-transporting ATPase subunit gamma
MAPMEVEYSGGVTASADADVDGGADGSGEDSGSSSESSSSEGQDGPQALYEFEPDADTLFDALLPKYVGARLYAALLESAASESANRQRAMKAATDNANELIRNLTLEANQARQAQITQEISEIVGGVDALASAGSES